MPVRKKSTVKAISLGLIELGTEVRRKQDWSVVQTDSSTVDSTIRITSMGRASYDFQKKLSLLSIVAAWSSPNSMMKHY